MSIWHGGVVLDAPEGMVGPGEGTGSARAFDGAKKNVLPRAVAREAGHAERLSLVRDRIDGVRRGRGEHHVDAVVGHEVAGHLSRPVRVRLRVLDEDGHRMSLPVGGLDAVLDRGPPLLDAEGVRLTEGGQWPVSGVTKPTLISRPLAHAELPASAGLELPQAARTPLRPPPTPRAAAPTPAIFRKSRRRDEAVVDGTGFRRLLFRTHVPSQTEVPPRPACRLAVALVEPQRVTPGSCTSAPLRQAPDVEWSRTGAVHDAEQASHHTGIVSRATALSRPCAKVRGRRPVRRRCPDTAA